MRIATRLASFSKFSVHFENIPEFLKSCQELVVRISCLQRRKNLFSFRGVFSMAIWRICRKAGISRSAHFSLCFLKYFDLLFVIGKFSFPFFHGVCSMETIDKIGALQYLIWILISRVAFELLYSPFHSVQPFFQWMLLYWKLHESPLSCFCQWAISRCSSSPSWQVYAKRSFVYVVILTKFLIDQFLTTICEDQFLTTICD